MEMLSSFFSNSTLLSPESWIPNFLIHSISTTFLNQSSQFPSDFGFYFPSAQDFSSHFSFTPFQVDLVLEFVTIIVGTIPLILIAWLYYGFKISRLVLNTQPVPNDSIIEELRLSKQMDLRYR